MAMKLLLLPIVQLLMKFHLDILTNEEERDNFMGLILASSWKNGKIAIFCKFLFTE